MKFYIVEDNNGEIKGCARSSDSAKVIAAQYELHRWDMMIVDCPVNPETIRRLLGQLGGYASATARVSFDGLEVVS